MDDDELSLSVLDDEARECAPRPFALYGVYRDRLDPDDDGMFLAYGLEFDEPRRAIMWEPGATWHSDSADRLLRRRSKHGVARLIWLGL